MRVNIQQDCAWMIAWHDCHVSTGKKEEINNKPQSVIRKSFLLFSNDGIRKLGLFFSILVTVWANVFPSYVRIITKVMETINYSSKKDSKDTCPSITWYFFKGIKPKSVIRPKQEDYSSIIASFHILSAFLSAFCFHLRFDIARYAFNATVATCSKQTLTRDEI